MQVIILGIKPIGWYRGEFWGLHPPSFQFQNMRKKFEMKHSKNRRKEMEIHVERNSYLTDTFVWFLIFYVFTLMIIAWINMKFFHNFQPFPLYVILDLWLSSCTLTIWLLPSSVMCKDVVLWFRGWYWFLSNVSQSFTTNYFLWNYDNIRLIYLFQLTGSGTLEQVLEMQVANYTFEYSLFDTVVSDTKCSDI